MAATLLILAGFLGLISHYIVRWKQGRTGSSFKDYMLKDWLSSVQSIIANIASSIGIFISLPDDVGGKLLLGAAYAAYMAGYVFDSGMNKDANPTLQGNIPVPVQANKTIQDIAREDSNKSINDLLDSDK
jgi:hypothetical protein